MARVNVVKAQGPEDNAIACLARIDRIDSSYNLVIAQQSHFTSITRRITDSDGTVIDSGTALTVSSVVFNAYQTGNVWSANGGDSTGFNFLDSISHSKFPVGGKTYFIEYTCVLSDGTQEVLEFEYFARDLRGS